MRGSFKALYGTLMIIWSSRATGERERERERERGKYELFLETFGFKLQGGSSHLLAESICSLACFGYIH
jgi:hypothetical protein